jgi:hypothetical protein
VSTTTAIDSAEAQIGEAVPAASLPSCWDWCTFRFASAIYACNA